MAETKACLFDKKTTVQDPPLDKRCNFFHCKIEIALSCSDSYTLEVSLLALKAAISSESCLLTLVYWGLNNQQAMISLQGMAEL